MQRPQTDDDDEWSMVRRNPGPIPVWPRTLRDCVDTLSVIFHRDDVRLMRYGLTVGITFPLLMHSISVWLWRQNVPRGEDGFVQVARAYEVLTDTEYSAAAWETKSIAAEMFLKRLYHYQQWIIWPATVCLSVIFAAVVCRDWYRYKKAHSGTGIMAFVTQWFQTTHWTTRAVCVLWVTAAVYQVFVWWQTLQAKRNPFHVLEISPTADLRTIKKAYRRLAFRYYPD